MNAPRVVATRSLSFRDGKVRGLATALNDFLEYGSESSPINVSVSRVEHDRSPGSYETTITLTIEEVG